MSMVLSMAPYAHASVLEVGPGEIGSGSVQLPAGGDVTLRGSVDASDLNVFVTCGHSFGTIDMSAVSIVSYEGSSPVAGLTRFPESTLPACVMAGVDTDRLILPETIEHIAECALTGSSFRTVTIPASVRTIGMGAFAGCGSLVRVDVPASLDSAGSHVFSGCPALEEVTWNTTAHIPSNAFAGCTSLVHAALSPDLVSIGEGAFLGCTSLSNVDFPPSLTFIADKAFARSGIAKVSLGDSRITYIGSQAFAECDNLESAHLPSSLLKMGEGVFSQDKSLCDVTLPSSLTVIPPMTFKGATALRSLSSSITPMTDSIGALAYMGLRDVAGIELPSGLRYIGDYAFEGMESLSYIDVSTLGSVPELGTEVWRGVDRGSVMLNPAPELAITFKATPQWQDFDFDTSISTSIDTPRALSRLRVRAQGHTLMVITDSDRADICLYDLSGHKLASRKALRDNVVAFDTSLYVSPVFIITVISGDGSCESVKILHP